MAPISNTGTQFLLYKRSCSFWRIWRIRCSQLEVRDKYQNQLINQLTDGTGTIEGAKENLLILTKNEEFACEYEKNRKISPISADFCDKFLSPEAGGISEQLLY